MQEKLRKATNSLVIFQDRLSLDFICLQSLDNCLWLVIVTLNERLPSQVIDALNRSYKRLGSNISSSKRVFRHPSAGTKHTSVLLSKQNQTQTQTIMTQSPDSPVLCQYRSSELKSFLKAASQ